VFREATAASANVHCAKRARLLYLELCVLHYSGMTDHFVARFVASVDPFSQPSNASFFAVHFMPRLVSQEYTG
jgi:hypothetical protein